jgi:hypothetical protein
MAQQPSEIKAHIKAEGESLKENLEEIQSRVKHALDWKVWYRNNTAVALGSIVAGGLLLSLLIPKGRSEDYDFIDMDDEVGPNGPARMRPRSNASSRIHHVLDNTMSAMFGVANDAFQEFMSKALPGFREHYSRAQTKRVD